MAAGLKRSISFFDAMAVELGAIIGAGIFVVLGVATGLAGPAVVVSIVLAGVVALLTASSFSRLSAALPKEGGVYEFAHELLSPSWGFLTGFLWLASNIVVAATVALGFAHYLSALFPSAPIVPIAFAACLLVTAINYSGIKALASVNNTFVAVKLLALLFFVIVGLIFFDSARLAPFAPTGWGGVLSGAALIFFAYGGFARITTISEEVKDARRMIPRVILLSLAISVVIYLLVAGSAAGLTAYDANLSPGAYLAEAMSITAIPYAAMVISLGALAATFSVLLTGVLGVSRVAFAMSKNGELPRFFSELDRATGVPRKAVLVSGLASAALTLIGDLVLVASVSSFAMLAYYAVANYCATRLKPRARAVPLVGLVSCLGLMAFLSPQSIILGLAVILCGVVYHYIWQRVRLK